MLIIRIAITYFKDNVHSFNIYIYIISTVCALPCNKLLNK